MKQIKNIELTIPQMAVVMSPQKNKYLELGRGAGKSTILGYSLRELVMQMPRASFALVGSTYSQILSRTLPSTIEGLEMFNLHQDIDFVIGKSGKKLGYEMPFQPPNQWNNIIHFPNGAICQMVSLDNPNSGRGLNSYAEIGDEAALFDPEKLFTNVKTTNRAKKAIFKKASLLGAEIYASSTPLTRRGKWFTEMEEMAKRKPNDYIFIKASAKSNPHLRSDWFNKMKEQAPSQLLYEAEILNIRPKEITDGFYANLDPKKHYYTDHDNGYLEGVSDRYNKAEHFNSNQDNDVRRNEPLIVSLDFGVFNCAVVMQHQEDTVKVLKSFHVKSPKLLDDLILEQFIPYYRPHQEKIIYLYGGHDGNNRLPNSSKTLFEQVSDLLRAQGWTVHLLTKGGAPEHYEKYILLNAMLKGTDTRLPSIRINESNNPDLIIALERAEAIEANNGVAKNKKDERNKDFPQQHAPHLTDAFDVPLFTMFNDIFIGKNQFLSETRIGAIR